jgi:hypothetical protein
MSLSIERFRDSSYKPFVRAWCLVACVLGLAVAGCYNPQVKNGGFACTAADDPPCPAGFYCVDNLCVDHPGAPGSVGGDLAVGTGGNGAEDLGTDAGSADLAVADMSKPADMAKPPADMANNACGATGDFCLSSSDCCSNSCFLFSCD